MKYKEVDETVVPIHQDYEQWLQEDLLKVDYQSTVNESKEEMFQTFDDIVKQLYKAVKNKKVHKIDNQYYIDALINLKKCFIKNVKITVTFDINSTEQGYFLYGKSWYNFLTDKIEDVYLGYIEITTSSPKINEREFYRSMFHELQHVYRHYFILKDEELKKRSKQDVETSQKKDTENYLYNNFMKPSMGNFTKNLFYCLNTNELNSHFSEIYPFVKNNKDINFKNYKQYLDIIPGYEIIKRLYEYQHILNNDYIEQNPFIKTEIGQSFFDVYNKNPFYQYKNLTPNDCFIMTRKKVSSVLLYAEKKFYQFLKSALTRLKRKKNKVNNF